MIVTQHRANNKTAAISLQKMKPKKKIIRSEFTYSNYPYITTENVQPIANLVHTKIKELANRNERGVTESQFIFHER